MRYLTFGVIALAAVGTSPLAAAPAHRPVHAAAPVQHDARLAAALELAKATQPEDLVVSAALRQMDRDMVPAMRSNEQIGAIEAALPGFTERYYAAARPELEKAFHARLPKLWNAITEIVASHLTLDQIKASTAFYSSPVGRKLIRLQADNLDGRSLLKQGIEDGVSGTSDTQRTAASIRSETMKAALSSLAQLSPAERSAIATFNASETGRALRQINADVAQATLAWTADHDPAVEARMGEIAMSVVADMKNSPPAKPAR